MAGIELQMINPTLFFRYLEGRLVAKMGQNYLPPLHLSLCHSKTEWAITTTISALTAKMMPLYYVKIS